MLTIRTSAHIITNRLLKSFHGVRTSTGVRPRRPDAARLVQERYNLFVRNLRREWLSGYWKMHRESIAHKAP